MRVLSTENFKHISPLLRENYANLHAQMEVRLTPETSAMFSKFTLQPSTGGAQWSVRLPEEDSIRPYAEANEEERDQISMAIKRADTELKKVFPAIANKLVEVPDEASIFFYTRGNKLCVVLAQWGFRRINSSVNTSIIKLCLERAERLTSIPVKVNLKASDGTPLANQEFTMLIFNREVSFTTDGEGNFDAGMVREGTAFRIERADGEKSEAFTVSPGQEVYEVVFNTDTSLTVRIEDENGQPISGMNTMFGDETKPTDENGEAVYGPIPYSGDVKVTVSAEGFEPVEKTLEADPKKNVVVFTCRPPQPEELPEPELPEEPEEQEVPEQKNKDVRIRVVDKHGFPQANLPVKVLCQKGFEETTTDNDGWVTLKSEDLIPGEKPSIELLRPKPGKRDKKTKASAPAQNKDKNTQPT